MATAPVLKRKRDWFAILRLLKKNGISLHEVARCCDRNINTVYWWQNGSEPKESDARIVLALMAKHAPAEYALHQREFDIRLEVH